MLVPLITGAAAVGAAVTAAVYVNFSARVMPRLAALPAPEGIATMQRFNEAALRAPFMTAFFGTAALSVGLLVRAVRAETRTLADGAAAAGGGLYLAGFVLTIAVNVPRNERLTMVEPGSPVAQAIWWDYLSQWTAANSVRGAFSAAATLALGYAAVALARHP